MMSFTSSTAQGGGLLDAGNMALRDAHPQWHQGICADLIATLEGATREDVDTIGYVSQQRAKVAIEEGRFAKSVVPVYNEDGTLALDHDEFPRPQTTMEGLSQLPAVFENFMPMPFDDTGETWRGFSVALAGFAGPSAEGRIRFKDVRGKRLDEVVEELLAEMRAAEKAGEDRPGE